MAILPFVYVCGDVHPAGGGDGDADVFDAHRMLKMAVGLIVPTPQEIVSGDIQPDNDPLPDLEIGAEAEPDIDPPLHGDGDIDVLDALRSLKAAVGLVTITSCGGPVLQPAATPLPFG